MFEIFDRFKGIIGAKITKDTSVVLLGNLISSSLAVVFTILAARALGPENWGIIAAIGSILTILVAFGDLGMTSALFRFVSKEWEKGDKDKAAKTIKAIWNLRLLTVAFFALILLFFAPVLSSFLLKNEDPIFVVFVAIGLIGALFVDFQIAISETRQEWKKAAVFISLTNSLRVLGLFIIGLSNLTLINVAFVFTGASLFAYIVSLFRQKTPIGLLNNWQNIIREVIPFSGLMGINRIISSVASRIDVLLLIQLMGAYEAGIYGAANRLAIGVPLILGSFATVLAPRLASISDNKELRLFLQRSMGLSVVITVGLILGIFIAPLVVGLFGSAYSGSRVVLQFLLIAFIPAAISVPLVNYIIYSLKKPQIITFLSFVQLAIVVFINYLFIPKIGVYAPAFALGIANLLAMSVTFFVAFVTIRRKQ